MFKKTKVRSILELLEKNLSRDEQNTLILKSNIGVRFRRAKKNEVMA